MGSSDQKDSVWAICFMYFFLIFSSVSSKAEVRPTGLVVARVIKCQKITKALVRWPPERQAQAENYFQN